MEFLCGNRLIDPPEVEGAQWIAVEDMHVSNFTPATVRRIREWLFGCSFHSMAIMDNFSLLCVLFASCGSAEFDTLLGDIGYTWSPRTSSEQERNQLEAMGLLSDDEWPELNWLEYQARLVTGALRPQDMFYQPYNLLEQKSFWGRELLVEGDEDVLRGLMEEGEDWEDISPVPWVLWERASSGKRDVQSAMIQMMMGRLGMS